MNLEIKKASINDIEILADISYRTFNDTFAEANDPGDMADYLAKSFNHEKLLLEIDDENSQFWLLYTDSALCGYTKIKWGPKPDSRDTGTLEICRFYIEKQYKGLGLGKSLMQRVLNFAKENGAKSVWLDVWKENPSAIAFYKKSGFEITGEQPFLVGKDLQEDYIMEKQLTLDK